MAHILLKSPVKTKNPPHYYFGGPEKEPKLASPHAHYTTTDKLLLTFTKEMIQPFTCITGAITLARCLTERSFRCHILVWFIGGCMRTTRHVKNYSGANELEHLDSLSIILPLLALISSTPCLFLRYINQLKEWRKQSTH